jgi:hypothetical protein
MDRTDGSDDEWQYLYDQLIRRVDYQIKKKERIDAKAQRFIRLLLTTVLTTVSILSTIIAALLTDLISIPSESSLNIPESVFELQEIHQSVAGILPVYSYPLGRFISNFLIFVLLLSIPASIYYLLILPLSRFYRAIQLSVLEPAIQAENVLTKLQQQPDRSETRDFVISEYSNIISKNEEALEEIEEYYNKSYESIPKGIWALMAGIVLTLGLFISGDAVVLVYSFLSIIALAIIALVGKVEVGSIRKLVTPKLWPDVVLAIAYLFFYIMILFDQYDLMASAFVLLLIILLVFSVILTLVRTDTQDLGLAFSRDILFSTGGMGLWSLTSIGSPTQSFEQSPVLAVLLIVPFLVGLLLGTILVIKNIYQTATESPLIDQLRERLEQYSD